MIRGIRVLLPSLWGQVGDDVRVQGEQGERRHGGIGNDQSAAGPARFEALGGPDGDAGQGGNRRFYNSR